MAGTLLAEGVNAAFAAEGVIGFPQSRQNRAAASFSWPHDSHVTFAEADVGGVDEVEEGGVIAHLSREGRTA